MIIEDQKTPEKTAIEVIDWLKKSKFTGWK